MKLRMKQIRDARGLSQQEVADRVGIPVRRYGSYERGERNINLKEAALIADVLDCTLDELAGRDFHTATSFADSRQAELNRIWAHLDPERQDRLVGTAVDMEAAKGVRSSAVPSEKQVS